MPVTVAEAIREGQRGIRALEPEIVRALLGHYELAWHAVERILLRYEAQIQAAIDAGIEPRPSWLRQQVWYRRMQDSIDREMARFEVDAARTLAYGQQQAVGISGQSARLFTAAVGVEGGVVARVNASAFERWVSALQPGSPVRGMLAKYGPRFEDAIARNITEGIGAGLGPRQMVRNIEREVGTLPTRGRLHTIARTESMRAFRGASRDAFEAMGPRVVGEWEWRSTLSARTCIACISLHRQRFPYNQYPGLFHPSCRCVVVAVPRAELVPPSRPGETGTEWFARQDEATQRRMLPTTGHWEAYRKGVPLTSMTTVRHSRVWGDAIGIKPAGKLP